MTDRLSAYRSQAFALAAIVLGACQTFDPTVREYEALLEHQKMVIKPYSAEATARHGQGFEISMRPAEAREVGAPSSQEFSRLLEDQLAVERSNGKSYCANGYDVGTMRQFKHWYTTIEVGCK